MSTTTATEMRVEKVFRFQDGRTVFVGRIEGDAKFISPGRADVVANGRFVATIETEGEMIASGRSPGGERSVSTLTPIELAVLNPESTGVLLHLHDMV